jgi:hypothetical protein
LNVFYPDQLFGQDGADLVAERLEREPASTFQLTLFPDKTDAPPKVKGKKTRGKKATDKDLRTNLEATTLDRVHAAMLLQASGRTNALRALLQAEQDRGPIFYVWRTLYRRCTLSKVKRSGRRHVARSTQIIGNADDVAI